MRFVRGGHFWQFGSTASLATETTNEEIFWPKHGLRSDLRVTNFPGGACPQIPLAKLFTFKVARSSVFLRSTNLESKLIKLIKLVKMWLGGTLHVVVGTLKISLDRLKKNKLKKKKKKTQKGVF